VAIRPPVINPWLPYLKSAGPAENASFPHSSIPGDNPFTTTIQHLLMPFYIFSNLSLKRGLQHTLGTEADNLVQSKTALFDNSTFCGWACTFRHGRILSLVYGGTKTLLGYAHIFSHPQHLTISRTFAIM
jgi:hypothetical protein